MDADRKAYNHQRHSMATMAALSQEIGGTFEADIAAAEAIRAADIRLATIAEVVRLDRLEQERGAL